MLTGCNASEPAKISKRPFGTIPSGDTVELYTLVSSTGTEVKITNFGGRITSVLTPDKNDNYADFGIKE